MTSPMKAASFWFLLLAGLAVSGCESELPRARQSTNRIQSALSGNGTLYQPDRSDDPVIRESSRVGN